MKRTTYLFSSLLPLAAAAFLMLAPASAHAEIKAEHPTAYATSPQQKNGAAYMTLKNTEAQADTLTSVSTPVAERAELHTTEMSRSTQTGADIMAMRPIESVAVPENGSVEFEPMGKHVMLMGLQKQLIAGETFPLTLHFEKAGDITVDVSIIKQGDMSGMSHEDGHEGHDMHDMHDHQE